MRKVFIFATFLIVWLSVKPTFTATETPYCPGKYCGDLPLVLHEDKLSEMHYHMIYCKNHLWDCQKCGLYHVFCYGNPTEENICPLCHTWHDYPPHHPWGRVMQEHLDEGEGVENGTWMILTTKKHFILGGIGQSKACEEYNSQIWNNERTNYREDIEKLHIGWRIIGVAVYQFATHPKLNYVGFCGNAVDTIHPFGFYKEEKLKEITLDDSIISISYAAFSRSRCLKHVIFGKGLRSIEMKAFYWCDLREAFLPERLREIGEYGFSKNTHMRRLEFGKSNLNLKQYAFQGCKSLKNVYIPSNVNVIDKTVFIL